MLLDAGAYIDAVTGGLQETACHVAIERNHSHVVDVLLARGANLALRDKCRRTPLCTAVFYRNERATIALINAGAPLDVQHTLCHAAAMSTTVLTMLLERQINVAVLRTEGNGTACHAAALRQDGNSDVDVIGTLLDVVGIDVNARWDGGGSCSQIAAAFRNPSALRKFIEHGADVTQADDFGWSPLHAACRPSNDSCVVLLLAAGADVYARDDEGETACHLAANSPKLRTCLVDLVAAGADLDTPSKNGTTARQLAVLHGIGAPTACEIAAAKRRITRTQLDFVRNRAFQVCVGLQSLSLDALQVCHILEHACGPVAPLVSSPDCSQHSTTQTRPLTHSRSKLPVCSCCAHSWPKSATMR